MQTAHEALEVGTNEIVNIASGKNAQRVCFHLLASAFWYFPNLLILHAWHSTHSTVPKALHCIWSNKNNCHIEALSLSFSLTYIENV